jgi:alginate O-acetyltransferase complex protein AlgI
MVFSSVIFLFIFLPLFLIVYQLAKANWRNYVLLIFSLAFYAWGGPKFVFLLLGSMSVNFFVVRGMYHNKEKRKLLLVLSLIINVGMLGYFKYANFFVENFNAVLESFGFTAVEWTKVILPIGISFFTFQSITYTIDVYRNVHRPLKKLSDYLLYIVMFPQLIAGPIVRFNTVADDILDRRHNDTVDNKLYGIYLFIIGLSKKVLVANALGGFVDETFASNISNEGTGILWLAIVAYSFQIYFDFSGYSDMAIGLGRIIGFKFPENFNNPYISQNITEFWRRWHITLGTWMRDYLYIPLGGNRVGSKGRMYLNLIIVFLISGFWHGASWNFVIWGAWHGLFLILDRLFLIKLLGKIGKLSRVFINYIIVLIGWVFFRAETLGDAAVYIKRMFLFDFKSFDIIYDKELLVVLIIAAVFAFSNLFRIGRISQNFLYREEHNSSGHTAMTLISIILFVLCVSYVVSSGFNPFIYFRF